MSAPSRRQHPSHHQQSQSHALASPAGTSGSAQRDTMASIAAWRDQLALSSEDGDRLETGSSEDMGGSGTGGGGGGGATKRSEGGKEQPARRRLVTTPHQVSVLSEELRRNPFPSAERRDALAKELGMEPRRVQVWFQNRRQAERLQRGRPVYSMMYPYYGPGYPYPGGPAPYPPAPGIPGYPMPPPGAPTAPGWHAPGATGVVGDPYMDILVPYGPRRQSALPPLIAGDHLSHPSLGMSPTAGASLASSSRDADPYAAGGHYRLPSLSGVGGPAAGSSRGAGMQMPELRGYGPPSTLDQDLARLPPERESSTLERGSLSRSRDGPSSSGSLRASASQGNMQPFRPMDSLSSHAGYELPLPNIRERPGSSSSSAAAGLDPPFVLPPPVPRRSGGYGAASQPSPFPSSFSTSEFLSRPLLSGNSLSRSTASGTPGKLPSLSQALEMHSDLPELSTSGFYSGQAASPARPGTPSGLRRRSSFGNLGGGAGSSLPSLGGTGRLPGSLGELDLPPLRPLNTSLAASSGKLSSLNNSSSARLAGAGAGSGGDLLPLPPLSSTMSIGSESFRSPRARTLQSSQPRLQSHSSHHHGLDSPMLHHPLSQLQGSSSASSRLRRMPSDVAMQSSLRRQGLRDAEMSYNAGGEGRSYGSGGPEGGEGEESRGRSAAHYAGQGMTHDSAKRARLEPFI